MLSVRCLRPRFSSAAGSPSFQPCAGSTTSNQPRGPAKPSEKASRGLRPWVLGPSEASFWMRFSTFCHLFGGDSMEGCYLVAPFVPSLPLRQQEVSCRVPLTHTDGCVHLSEFLPLLQLDLCARVVFCTSEYQKSLKTLKGSMHTFIHNAQ